MSTNSKVSRNLNSRRGKLKAWFEDYEHTIKQITYPTKKEWFTNFWKVCGVVVTLGILFLVFDYLVLKIVLMLHENLPHLTGPDVLITLYMVFLVITGLLTVAGVLFQKGTSDGLTSLFGSNMQASTSISGVIQKVSKFTVYVGSFFTLLCLFAPVMLGSSL